MIFYFEYVQEERAKFVGSHRDGKNISTWCLTVKLEFSEHCKYLIAPMMLLAFMILLGINRYSSNRGDGFENLRLVLMTSMLVTMTAKFLSPILIHLDTDINKNFISDAEFKHLLREMEASGLKTGSVNQKATGTRKQLKPRSSKAQICRFKSKASKLSYRSVTKQTSGRRTLSLLQAVNEAVKNSKVRFSIEVK